MRIPSGALTEAEREELGQRIANGDIAEFDTVKEIDYIDLQLSSGKLVWGSYKWAAEDEWLTFAVQEA